MAWSAIQNKEAAKDDATFDSTPSVNSLIVVVLSTWEGSIGASDISDNQGNTYTRAVYSDNSGVNVGIFYAIATTSSGSFVVSNDGGQGDYSIGIHEFTGNATSSVLSQNASDTGQSTTPNSGNITSSDANEELFFGTQSHDGENLAQTEGSGWTEMIDFPDGSSHMPLHTQYKTSTGTDASDHTIGDWQNWVCLIASFEPLAEGTTTSTTTTSTSTTTTTSTTSTSTSTTSISTTSTSTTTTLTSTTTTQRQRRQLRPAQRQHQPRRRRPAQRQHQP